MSDDTDESSLRGDERRVLEARALREENADLRRQLAEAQNADHGAAVTSLEADLAEARSEIETLKREYRVARKAAHFSG